MSSDLQRTNLSAEAPILQSIQLLREHAAESFQKWCYSWLKGPELDDALSKLQSLIDIVEKFNIANKDVLLSDIWQQKATYHEQRAFRLAKKQDAEQALECSRKACESNPKNFAAQATVAYMLQYIASLIGNRKTLENVFDAVSATWLAIPENSPGVVDLLLYTGIALYERAEYDGSRDDLDMALEVLRAGASLAPDRNDRLLIFKLMCIDILTLRFETGREMQDLEDAEKIVIKLRENEKSDTVDTAVNVVNELHDRIDTQPVEVAEKVLNSVRLHQQISPMHRPFQQEVFGNFYLAKFETFKRKDDMIAMNKCFFEMLTSIGENSSCPQRCKITASWKIAKALRLSYHFNYGSLILNRAHAFGVDASNLIQASKAEWPVQQLEAAVLFTLGEIQRSRFESYGAARLLEDSLAHFRSSALLTPRDQDAFGRRAAALVGILRRRASSGLVDQAQASADMIEAQMWIRNMILGPRPFRLSDQTETILQLGHLVWDLPSSDPARINKVISHYSAAIEVRSLEFGPYTDALRSAGEAWTRKGQDSKDANDSNIAQNDLKAALQFFDQIEIIAKERGAMARGTCHH